MALQLFHLLFSEAASEMCKGGCEQDVLTEGKPGEKAEVCQIIRELD